MSLVELCVHLLRRSLWVKLRGCKPGAVPASAFVFIMVFKACRSQTSDARWVVGRTCIVQTHLLCRRHCNPSLCTDLWTCTKFTIIVSRFWLMGFCLMTMAEIQHSKSFFSPCFNKVLWPFAFVIDIWLKRDSGQWRGLRKPGLKAMIMFLSSERKRVNNVPWSVFASYCWLMHEQSLSKHCQGRSLSFLYIY